jgi:hypothetical protein
MNPRLLTTRTTPGVGSVIVSSRNDLDTWGSFILTSNSSNSALDAGTVPLAL